MFDLNKVYWLYIASHIYCCIKENQALLYNTKTGDNIETNNQEVLTILKALHEKKNLGAIRFDGKILEQFDLQEFFVEFCRKGMGNLVDIAKVPERPIQLMPVLNLQRDLEKLKSEDERYIGENILKYLLELNIYLYTSCNRHCSHCDKYFRQNLCCSTFSDKEAIILDYSVLQNLLSQIQYGLVGQLNLLGGNIFEYPNYNDLSQLLTNFNGHVHIWNHYTTFSDHKIFHPDFIYDVVVNFPINENQWKLCTTSLSNQQTQFHFYMTHIEEYREIESLIEEYEIKNYSIHPTYTGLNYNFFEENTFIDRDDIFQKRPHFRHIFAHQKLNTHFFGSLTITANGETYSNINSTSLGNVKYESLLDIINKEMTLNTSWRKIRDTQPCSDCLYQYLCPSPSNYETVMGKMNLCHIKK